jgi:hypothetical protein
MYARYSERLAHYDIQVKTIHIVSCRAHGSMGGLCDMA